MAQGTGQARIALELRAVERSRRLLLMRAIVDQAGKIADLATPLPPADDAWELLARAQHVAPDALDLVLAHPYAGSWAGYTTRLLTHHITGVGPLWAHIGHVHALAAAAGIRAGISFETTIPVWQGHACLPTLGTARRPADTAWTVATVRSHHGRVEIDGVHLPADLTRATPEWWPVRHIALPGITIRLDDVDPYRGLYEPVLPQRIETAEVDVWRGLLTDAWQLLRDHRPDFADMMRIGFDTVVPRPLVVHRTPSGSSDDAFGSAIIARPPTAPVMAAILVHEFQHSVLCAVSRLVQLSEPDPREHHYTGWRDDPRPTSGMLQGLFAFFGVATWWRALASTGDRLAMFEFAHHRAITWRAVRALRHDPVLTDAGRRFVTRIGDELGSWQAEPVPADVATIADRVGADHRIGWRLRYIRPSAHLVTGLATAWRAGQAPLPILDDDPAPNVVPDGAWSHARTDLCRVLFTRELTSYVDAQAAVPDATRADFALATGRFVDAARSYQAELAGDPDRPASWAGLALALTAIGPSPAGRVLSYRPELVRAVHRTIRSRTDVPTPMELATWLGGGH